jgi:hypothetical protein
MQLERRDFLKLVGIESVALGGLTLLSSCNFVDQASKSYHELSYDGWNDLARNYYESKGLILPPAEIITTEHKNIQVINGSGMSLDESTLTDVYQYFEGLPTITLPNYPLTNLSGMVDVSRETRNENQKGLIYVVPRSAGLPGNLELQAAGLTAVTLPSNDTFITFVTIPSESEYRVMQNTTLYYSFIPYEQYITGMFLTEACQSSISYNIEQPYPNLKVSPNEQRKMLQEAGCNTYQVTFFFKDQSLDARPNLPFYDSNGFMNALNTVPITQNEVDSVPEGPVLK